MIGLQTAVSQLGTYQFYCSIHGGLTIRQMLSHVTGMQREPVGDVWDKLQYPDRTGLVAG